MKILALGVFLAAFSAQAQEHDHSKMDHSTMVEAKTNDSTMDHSKSEDGVLKTPIPEVTDADRAAAFPQVHAHHMHGTGVYGQVLFERFEVNSDDALAWQARTWVGGDVQRLLVRSEGAVKNGRTQHTNVELLYSRGTRAWWDFVAGIKQDIGGERPRTWAAVGVEGLAPLKIEVSATGYVADSGHTAVALEAEYETLITNRLIVQWQGEAALYGKADPANGLGKGLSSVNLGARMRYEITRQFAPYVGVEHERLYGETAELAGWHRGQSTNTSIVAGIRFWF